MAASYNVLTIEKLENEKCGCCTCCPMKVETGTLVFAILNCIFNGSMVILSIIALATNDWHNSEGFHILVAIPAGIALICSAVGFSFGVVLAKGVTSRRSGYVEIYFVYGVVAVVLLAVAAAVIACFVIYAAVGIWLICFLHSIMLVMVRATYKKFEAERRNVGTRLVEDKL